MERNRALRESPLRQAPRRVADGMNPAGARKVHSWVDKVYTAKSRQRAWERVKANRGAGGVDGVTRADFEARLEEQLKRLQEELRTDTHRPQPVRQKMIPKPGKPGERRPLGRPTSDERGWHQALLHRLEPICEAECEEANCGSRQGRSATDARRQVWRELEGGAEGIVEADRKDCLGTVDHAKLMTLVARKGADGRVLRRIASTLNAGCSVAGRQLPTTAGTPQGGGRSPLLRNLLLTPVERERRRRGDQLTRYGDGTPVQA
jgi:RNA-directed DNA polymerase